MRIGTPLSSSAVRVMLLGSGELGKEVIIAFQRLGVEVIAVDRYANAPGHQVAHRFHVIDMTDANALQALVEQEKPHFIVPEIEAIATNQLAEIEKSGLATVIPLARATQLTMNREGIRRLAAETLGIPTSKYAFADTLKELQQHAADIGYPCVIKPVMSSSGKGQSIAANAEDLIHCWNTAMQAGRVKINRVIIEEMVAFDYEITLLTVRANDVQGDGIKTSFCEPVGHRQVSGDYVESWQPQAMSEKALQKAQEMARKITTDLGGRGLFGVEFFVRGDEVLFSEVSPRPHDTGMVTMISQYQNEFALHARAILGLPVDTRLFSAAASAVIYGEHEAEGIVFDGVAKALSIPDTEIRLFGKPVSFKHRRMGVALARGKDITQARERAKEAASRVKPATI